MAGKINSVVVSVALLHLPTVLSLEELTGFCGSTDKYLETTINAMTKMDLDDGVRFIAATMDDPNVMQAFW